MLRADTDEELALRLAIARDPSDVGAYLVYSDWLISHGDTLGELLAIGLALEQPGAPRDALKTREQELVAMLARRFFGAFAGQGTVVWRRGFALRFAFGVDAPCLHPHIEEVLPAYLLSPAAMVLRDLVLGDITETAPDIFYVPELATLAGLALPPSLRRFAIGPQRGPVDRAFVGALAPALARMPGLEVLVVGGTDIDLGAASLPRLRRIELTTISPRNETLDALARFDALETASVDLCGKGDLGPLVEVLPRLPPSVKSLNLRGLPSSAGVVDAILAWPHVATLEELTLSRGDLSGAGARMLLELTQLARLDLTGQSLPLDVVDSLCTTFGDRLSVGPP